MMNLNHVRPFAARLCAAVLLLASTGSAWAAVRYADVNSTNAAPPFMSWATAATNIQDAVDAAVAGDEIVVTNGIYATGGRAVVGTMTNRVAVDKPLTLRSVNGPEFTIIQGCQLPGTTNGDGAIRCVYLTNGASLSGFTLTNGATRTTGDYEQSGGGLWCESTNAVLVSNCVMTGNSAYSYGGGVYSGTLYNCTLIGNSGGYGAAVYGAILNNCTLAGNSARESGGGAYGCTMNNCTLGGNSALSILAGGGGAVNSTLNHCTLTGNSAYSGGGADNSTLNNCVLTGNSARHGGGTYGGTLNNCTLTGNLADDDGGGASFGTVNNCTLSRNLAGGRGGGAYGGTLKNCTLTGNSARSDGGGANYGTLNNCIVYINTAPQGANYYSSTLNHSCTTPLPPDGAGNISVDPQLASSSHLSAASPCRGTGNAAYASGTDVDAEAWGNPPSIGCDEYHAGAVTGALTVVISAYTNTTVGEPIRLTALIEGRTTASVWEFGDGFVETNQPYTTHEWSAPGDYLVALRAFNESHPAGVSATVIVHVLTGVDGVHFVAAAGTSPVAPYSTWATAATNIQDAVDAAVAGDEIVVTNGTYATGGGNGNRVTVYKPLTLRSVNGPQFTVIQGFQVPGSTNGDGAIRCVSLANGSSLSGFTLTNGATRGYLAWDYPSFHQSSGGGLWCESTNGVVVSNCVMTGNSAYSYGGGVYSGTLYNCTLIGNSGGYGAGAYRGTLNNCTIIGSGSGSGGAYECTLTNCALTGNSDFGARYSTLTDCALNGNAGGAYACTLNNCTLNNNRNCGADSSMLNNCTLAGNAGSGAYGCMLTNCALTGNAGAGAMSSTLNNCTLTGNSTGGAMYSALNNCVAYFNTGENYDLFSTLNYSCTTPQPATGVGNISLDPQLASASRLSAGSPCRGAGNATYATGTDIDGEAWASPPSIGCDEYHIGALTGALSVAVIASFTNVTVGFAVQLTALIEGRAAANSWDFGDGVTATNQPYTSHAWTALGDYGVVLRAYNESWPGGISATVTVHVVAQPIHYVASDSGSPVAPYTSWATAATNIQDAVDAAAVPGALVLVTNGTYAAGGRLVDGYTNRVVIAKPLAVRSVNGWEFTVINGSQLVRCVYLTNTASLSGFNLTNSGYGAFGGTLNNCVLSGNSYSGADHCTLNNCALSGNGYGASFCTLNNCTLTGNGSGASSCTLNNCIAYFNRSANHDSSTLNYCCAAPLPSSGVGNISVDPQLANAWRLSAGSPCRGAGNVTYTTGTDIDGESWATPPSIGCDEYYPGALTGPLSVGITASFTNVSVGYVSQFTALIQGRAAFSTWDFGDGITVTNQPYTSHAWTALGDYAVVLSAYNESWPGGISATVTVHVVPGFHYVSASNTNPVAPYTSWATAATNIQAAINAAIEPGAQVLVTNGSYAPIGVPRLLSVRSVNGPGSTTISAGRRSRCAYLADGANLSGFTLSGGFADRGAGVLCESRTAVVSNCVLSGNKAGGSYSFGPRYDRGYGGGAYGGTLNNCTLINNSVTGYYIYNYFGTDATVAAGGGAYDCTLNNCMLSGNSAIPTSFSYCAYWCSGGGIPYCCETRSEYTRVPGGGAYSCTLNNCTLTGNSASVGGGAYGSTLKNCRLTSNASGADYSTLNNCSMSGNGIGAQSSTLNNCTLTGNSAGVSSSTLNNCIAYFNTGPNYDSSSTLNYCCTTPLPTNGVGNISSEPQLASFSHLSADSPCRGAGNAAYATGTDIDGEAWLNPPSIGCDEYHAGAVTGLLSVGMTASLATVTMGYTVQFTALIEGQTTGSVWDFGDGVTVTNQPYTSHAWTALGDYEVLLRAFNETWPDGISATTTVHVVDGIHYVAANNTNPLAPYTSWATAATNIQDAVDAAVEPGAQVLVTNGIYATGTRVLAGTNRVIVDKGLAVRSVNGPLFTTIDGGQSVRCVYLTSGGLLSGFTLTHGFAHYEGSYGYSSGYGGGALGGVLTNCILTGNSSDSYGGGGAASCTLNNCTLIGNSSSGLYGGGGASGCTLNNCTLAANSANGAVGGGAGYGGGAYECRLNNCALTGNSAGFGGGAAFCILTNCTVTGNSAAQSGGAEECALNNCVLYFNTSTNGANYDPSSTLNYCCTTPQPTNGLGNITYAPLFVDTNEWANLRLQSNSPCINAGNNLFDVASTDLDGLPRIAGDVVDIGAYEFQNPISTISYAWLQQYALPINANTDASNQDGDGMNNWQEWRCLTDPTNALSALRLLAPATDGIPPGGMTVIWQSVPAVNYFLERSTNLSMPPRFISLATDIPGQAGTTTYTDTNAIGAGPWFYRVGVGN